MYGLHSLMATESVVREKRSRYEAEAAQERLAKAARRLPGYPAARALATVQPWQLAQTRSAPCCEAA